MDQSPPKIINRVDGSLAEISPDHRPSVRPAGAGRKLACHVISLLSCHSSVHFMPVGSDVVSVNTAVTKPPPTVNRRAPVDRTYT